ncbi:MAG: penicillin-binding protein 2, partial [Candidatus Cloacimonetes bacterium]|nr:penicillin-binding protein 2 [Candidatus Cloacimonadota bacterium]
MLIKHPKINSLIYTISFLFFFLTFFLFKLQVIQGEKFQRIARENYVRIKTQTPVRGEIYDRKYRPIAINKPSYNLYIIPGKIKNTENVINFVAGEFDFSKKSVREIIHKNRF